MTALMLAVDNRFSIETISELISMGSDVNASDAEGMTSLHNSTILGDEKTFKLLLESGANPDIEDQDGDVVRKMVEDEPKLKTILQ